MQSVRRTAEIINVNRRCCGVALTANLHAVHHHLADNGLVCNKSSALDLPLAGGDVGAAVLGSIPGDSFTATPARRLKYLRPYLGPLPGEASPLKREREPPVAVDSEGAQSPRF
jgi:hypothetical protein